MSDIGERAPAAPAQPDRPRRGPLQRVREWLAAAPIADAVDRRNAPVMQLLLLFYGVALPSNWAWHLSSRPIPTGWGIVLALDLMTAATAFVSVALIRRGAFRLAIRLFLVAMLCSQALAYHKLGTQAQLIDQTAMILILVISGLVLGRRALWIAYGLVQLVFAVGWITDANNAQQSEQWISNALNNAPSLLVSYGIIAIVLDRTVTALRESLAESDARGRELQREMAERERAQSQLIHAQKLEATGRLASGVAHDFNNVLDLVLGFARQRHALREAGSAQEQIEALDGALEGAEAAAQRGVALTRKLLTFSRNDLLRIETFDAREVLAELKPMLRQLFPPTVQLRIEPGNAEAPVRLDRGEFELMMLNLAANARDAMPDGGSFTIEVARPDADTVEIVLADTGHGMDAHTRQRIFEPFFSTKDASVGTGLGLSVIRDLVKVAGGEIAVDSAPGQGARFVLRFPAA